MRHPHRFNSVPLQGGKILSSVTSGTILTQLKYQPVASSATTSISYHRLHEFGEPTGTAAFGFGDPTKRTYGATFFFGRTVLATSEFGGHDISLVVRAINKLANNGAYNLEGASIKAKNYTGGTVGDLTGLHIETVADGTTSTSKVLRLTTDGSTIDYGIDMRECATFGTADIVLSNGATITNGATDTLTITEFNIVIAGNLDVTGITTTVNSTILQIDDILIDLGTVDTPTDTTADGGGIILKGATDKTILWDKTTANWAFNQGINIPATAGTAHAISIGASGAEMPIFNDTNDYQLGVFGKVGTETSSRVLSSGRFVMNSDAAIARGSSYMAIQAYNEYEGESISTGGASVHNAIWATLESSVSGTWTIGANVWMSVITAGIDFPDVTAADADSHVSGIRITSDVESSASMLGDFAALRIDKQGGHKDWTVGIDINNATTGIDIGACDHGIRFSVMPTAGDDTNSFINIGDYGTALAVGPTTAHQFGVMHNVSLADINVSFAYQAHYTKIATSGTTTNTGIAGHALRMQVGSNLAAVYGVQSHVNFTADSTITQEAVAVSAYVGIATGLTATSYRTCAFQAMIANPGGTGTFTGESHVAYVVVAENATVDNALKIYTQSTTTTTNMLNIENDGIATTGILLNNDGTMTDAILIEGAYAGPSISVGVTGAPLSYSANEDINVAIYSNFTGDVAFFRGMYVRSDYTPDDAGESSVYGIRGQARLTSGQTHDAGALTDESFCGIHGYATNEGIFDAAGLTVAGLKGEIGGAGDWSTVKVACGVWAKAEVQNAVGDSAGEYTGVYVYAPNSTYKPDSIMYAWGYFTDGIDFSGCAALTNLFNVNISNGPAVAGADEVGHVEGSIAILVDGTQKWLHYWPNPGA